MQPPPQIVLLASTHPAFCAGIPDLEDRKLQRSLLPDETIKTTIYDMNSGKQIAIVPLGPFGKMPGKEDASLGFTLDKRLVRVDSRVNTRLSSSWSHSAKLV